MERQLEYWRSAADHALNAAEAVVQFLDDGEEKTAALLKLRGAVDENARCMKVAGVKMEVLKRLVGEEQEGDEDVEQVYNRLLKEEEARANADASTPDVVSRFERILTDHGLALPPRVPPANASGGAARSNGNGSSNTVIYNRHDEIDEMEVDVKPVILPSTQAAKDKS